MRLINDVIIFIALNSAMLPTISVAATYTWPIATSVDVELISATEAKYVLQMGLATISDPSIDDETSVREIKQKYFPSQTATWMWGAYHRHNAEKPGGAATLSLQQIEKGQDSEKILAVAKMLSDRYGHGTISTKHTGSPNGNECVGTSMWGAAAAFAPWESFPSRNWNGGAGSVAGSCLGTPPAKEWCALTEPAITLDFGSQVLANAPSARASATTRVECTTGMKYTLRLRGQDAILLANGMIANLTANNQALGATLNGERGLNNVTIGASLLGTPKSGSLNGSGVLFVSYP